MKLIDCYTTLSGNISTKTVKKHPMRPMFPRKTENDIQASGTQLHSVKSYSFDRNVKNPKHVRPTDTPAQETTKRILRPQISQSNVVADVPRSCTMPMTMVQVSGSIVLPDISKISDI